MSDREEFPLRIFLSEFSYSVDVCAHKFLSSEPRYVSSQQIRTSASPFPPAGTVAAPCGSPAVPRPHRYYGVVRLLHHPSRFLRSTLGCAYLRPIRRRSSLGWEEMGSSLRFLGYPCGACPGLETPPIPARPRGNGRCRILPSASITTSASDRHWISVLNPHGLLPRCVRFAPTSRPVNGNTRY